jgi:hypothetical protein
MIIYAGAFPDLEWTTEEVTAKEETVVFSVPFTRVSDAQ